jgi:hypothetical protein
MVAARVIQFSARARLARTTDVPPVCDQGFTLHPEDQIDHFAILRGALDDLSFVICHLSFAEGATGCAQQRVGRTLARYLLELSVRQSPLRRPRTRAIVQTPD